MAMRETTKMEYDGLLAGGIAAFTKNVAITAGTAMKRGTLMTVTDGTAAATATWQTPSLPMTWMIKRR